MSPNIKIHLADDHQVLLDGLKNLITTNPSYEISGFSLDGTNLIEKVQHEKAEILIMDINMPNVDGLEVLKEFAEKKPPFDIIVLSSYDDLKLIKEVMKLGAKGYLTKQCAGENILEAIQVVIEGQEYFCETVRTKIFSSFTKKNQQTVSASDHLIEKNISERELDILKLIALEYNTDEISEALFISINTVNTHRKNLIRKLNVKSAIGLVTYAIKHKLITN
jgi:DNA-binding NarL/FixJ family response regulator